MFRLLLLLTLLPLLSNAQKTILWKVTGNDPSKVSYLLGTYHIVPSSFVDRYPVIADKISASEVVITETKYDPEFIAKYYSSRPASDVSSLLSKEDYNYISRIMNREKTVDISKLTPGELIIKLRTNYVIENCVPKNESDSQYMDKYIQNIGRSKNKELYFLETDSFQLQQVSQLTEQFDAKYFKANISPLLKSLRNKNASKYACEMYNRYVALDFDYKLKEPMNATGDGVDNVKLVKARNDDWVSKLAPLLATRNCFVAVGQYHLYYITGIIQQLRAKGFTVEPVEL